MHPAISAGSGRASTGMSGGDALSARSAISNAIRHGRMRSGGWSRWTRRAACGHPFSVGAGRPPRLVVIRPGREKDQASSATVVVTGGKLRDERRTETVIPFNR
jgi:hypothetical protein